MRRAWPAWPGNTAAEIAYCCGFKNPFHFSRLLKKRTGRSPRDIRRQASQRDKGKTPVFSAVWWVPPQKRTLIPETVQALPLLLGLN